MKHLIHRTLDLLKPVHRLRGNALIINRTSAKPGHRFQIFGRCKFCGRVTLCGVCLGCDRATVCGWCGRIKQADNRWANVPRHKGHNDSHGICPECIQRKYPDVYLKMQRDNPQPHAFEVESMTVTKIPKVKECHVQDRSDRQISVRLGLNHFVAVVN